jgi:hypothetical protein
VATYRNRPSSGAFWLIFVFSFMFGMLNACGREPTRPTLPSCFGVPSTTYIDIQTGYTYQVFAYACDPTKKKP